MTDFRFYCFTHFMLSSIQHGIQTGHASVDLLVKYAGGSYPDVAVANAANHWARYNKTYITLNGGNSANLDLIEDTIRAAETRHPWISFYEDGASLCGIKTAVGVILPNTHWDVQSKTDDDGQLYFIHTPEEGPAVIYDQNHVDFELIKLIKSARLAA